MGVPPGNSSTTMRCPSMAQHPGVASRAAILFPYKTPFYDVMGLSAFSSLPLVGFCWTVDIRVSIAPVVLKIAPNFHTL